MSLFKVSTFSAEPKYQSTTYLNPCHNLRVMQQQSKTDIGTTSTLFAINLQMLASLLPFAIIIKIAITKIYHLETKLFGKQLVIVATYCQLHFLIFFSSPCIVQKFIALFQQVCLYSTLYLRGRVFSDGFRVKTKYSHPSCP